VFDIFTEPHPRVFSERLKGLPHGRIPS
jgi:hypothetical protein